MKDTVIIGNLRLLHDKVLKLYFENKYIITSGGIYQLFYSNAQRRAYGAQIYRAQNLTRRGTYRAATAAEVNALLCFQLLNED